MFRLNGFGRVLKTVEKNDSKIGKNICKISPSNSVQNRSLALNSNSLSNLAFGTSLGQFNRQYNCFERGNKFMNKMEWISIKDRRGGSKETKEKGGKSKGKDAEENAVQEFDTKEVEGMIGPCLEALKRELNGIKVVRANPSLLESMEVLVAGSKQSLSSLAQVTAKDASTLLVSVYDESTTKDILKSLNDSELKLTSVLDGEDIKVTPPKITTEYRESLKKIANGVGDKFKVSLRNIRKNGMDLMKKAKLPKDEEKRTETKIQNLVDEAGKSVTKLVEAKVKEIGN
eukprot:TRINITY_DN2405_c0_g1_i1.p1 TRINITY_DN2405_c0_g1~~TRINITY_DN2405_c0_g1_i1.p1  ORF type:complete len:287 (+),score=124.87 TRINITY_DN2405_c0_g1_i1:52-912(+)